MEKIKNYLKLIRVKHYIKNVLIFVPLIFSGLYNNLFNLYITILGFILFSLSSSIIYVINDICDIDKDKLHEIKKNRPLPSGKVSIKEAYSIILILFICFIFLSFIIYKNVSIYPILLILGYILINILYSKWLKNVVLVDVIVLVIGFLIRIFFGSFLIDTFVSNYLYLTVMSGAFYLGFGKRRNEMMKSDEKSRSVLKYYNKDFLDKNMYMFLALTIVFYSLWAVSAFNNEFFKYSIILVIVILLKYCMDVEDDNFGDPIEVITHDKVLLVLGALYIIFVFSSIYF